MKDIAIAIEVGSPNSTKSLVETTFESIRKNIGNCKWKVFICLGLNIPNEVEHFVRKYVSNYSKNFQIFLNDEVTWAEFINNAIDVSKDYRFFIKSHDDIELLTNNFFGHITTCLDQINKPVGWVSFTDIGWKKGDFSPPTRDGHYMDVIHENAWTTKKIFQFHLFPENWTKANTIKHYSYLAHRKINRYFKLYDPLYPKPIKKILTYPLDLPVAPVRCHAPFNHFVLIERKSLDLIGKCEDWGTANALLVDEDWGLRAMELNLPNIWIPSIEYYHHRGIYEGGGTRSWNTINKEALRVHQLFYEKWGFHENVTNDEIDFIREKHKNNLIPWSSFRRSFEWDYNI